MPLPTWLPPLAIGAGAGLLSLGLVREWQRRDRRFRSTATVAEAYDRWLDRQEVRVEALELLQGRFRALSGFDLVLVLLQQRAEHQPNVFFVVYDQDTAHQFHPILSA